jgi:hypothetical protein
MSEINVGYGQVTAPQVPYYRAPTRTTAEDEELKRLQQGVTGATG